MAESISVVSSFLPERPALLATTLPPIHMEPRGPGSGHSPLKGHRPRFGGVSRVVRVLPGRHPSRQVLLHRLQSTGPVLTHRTWLRWTLQSDQRAVGILPMSGGATAFLRMRPLKKFKIGTEVGWSSPSGSTPLPCPKCQALRHDGIGNQHWLFSFKRVSSVTY